MKKSAVIIGKYEINKDFSSQKYTYYALNTITLEKVIIKKIPLKLINQQEINQIKQNQPILEQIKENTVHIVEYFGNKNNFFVVYEEFHNSLLNTLIKCKNQKCSVEINIQILSIFEQITEFVQEAQKQKVTFSEFNINCFVTYNKNIKFWQCLRASQYLEQDTDILKEKYKTENAKFLDMFKAIIIEILACVYSIDYKQNILKNLPNFYQKMKFSEDMKQKLTSITDPKCQIQIEQCLLIFRQERQKIEQSQKLPLQKLDNNQSLTNSEVSNEEQKIDQEFNKKISQDQDIVKGNDAYTTQTKTSSNNQEFYTQKIENQKQYLNSFKEIKKDGQMKNEDRQSLLQEINDEQLNQSEIYNSILDKLETQQTQEDLYYIEHYFLKILKLYQNKLTKFKEEYGMCNTLKNIIHQNEEDQQYITEQLKRFSDKFNQQEDQQNEPNFDVDVLQKIQPITLQTLENSKIETEIVQQESSENFILALSQLNKSHITK